ncbi:N-acetylglucosamine-1-phosphate uridyltransferase / Glucosamine-1-phosphate N-acetyltransferase [hydrothermal vent metagenome]|uniref:UDP-N-acetylglucosamine diphosphorylase n=1 Tax=hydrothermal vent metagenome TaxID=652676 RepID=A0A3B0WEU1_9ZZZZ
MSLAIIILAAGHGSRMQSKKQKILHDVGGKPMVQHLFDTAVSLTSIPPVLIIGKGGDGVRQLFGDRATYAVQSEQLGTGHATQMAQPLLQNRADQVIVTYADMPLLQAKTLQKLATLQAETETAVTMLTVMGSPNSPFGRVVRDENGRVAEILEVTQAKKRPNSAELLAILEQNAGVYCFAANWLWENIDKLPLRQARSGSEYYLTDMIELAVQQDRGVTAVVTNDPNECLGAGTRAEMVAVEKAFRRRANSRWLAQGVTIIDPDSTYIDPDVTIGQDTIIWPNSYLQGKTAVGEDCIIGPNTILRNTAVGNGCHIEQAVVKGATLPAGTIVEPFTVLKGARSKSTQNDE